MPRNDLVTLPKNEVTEITINDVTAIAVSVLDRSIMLYGTIGSVPPTNLSNGQPLMPNEELLADVTLAMLFPGIAATRVWALAPIGARIRVSHA